MNLTEVKASMTVGRKYKVKANPVAAWIMKDVNTIPPKQ